MQKLRRLYLQLAFLLPLSVSCAKEVCTLEEVFEEKSPAVKHQSHQQITIEESLLNSYRSFLFLPSDPKPQKAPVILFLHGFFDATPEPYEAMLSYYARAGYIVIYPSYGNLFLAKNWADNAKEAFSRALDYLDENSAVKPNRQQVSFVGHSIGGLLAFHIANDLGQGTAGIPRPKTIVTSDMAGISSLAYSSVQIDDLSKIPSDTRFLMMMAEETYQARFKEKDLCANDAKTDVESNCNGFSANLRVMQRSPQIPTSNKQSLLILASSSLRSDHNAAQGECRNEDIPINAIDTDAYWRSTLDALEGRPSQSSNPSLNKCFLEGTCPPQKP